MTDPDAEPDSSAPAVEITSVFVGRVPGTDRPGRLVHAIAGRPGRRGLRYPDRDLAFRETRPWASRTFPKSSALAGGNPRRSAPHVNRGRTALLAASRNVAVGSGAAPSRGRASRFRRPVPACRLPPRIGGGHHLTTGGEGEQTSRSFAGSHLRKYQVGKNGRARPVGRATIHGIPGPVAGRRTLEVAGKRSRGLPTPAVPALLGARSRAGRGDHPDAAQGLLTSTRAGGQHGRTRLGRSLREADGPAGGTARPGHRRAIEWR